MRAEQFVSSPGLERVDRRHRLFSNVKGKREKLRRPGNSKRIELGLKVRIRCEC